MVGPKGVHEKAGMTTLTVVIYLNYLHYHAIPLLLILVHTYLCCVWLQLFSSLL